MRDEECDLSFADFGASDVSRRLYPSPASADEDAGSANPAKLLARREGFDASRLAAFGCSPPTLRFEACGQQFQKTKINQ